MPFEDWPIPLSELPGPRRWLQQIDDQLEHGVSCLVIVPDDFAGQDYEIFYADLSDKLSLDQLPAGTGSASLSEVLGEVFCLDTSLTLTTRVFRDVVDADVAGPTRILLRGWEHDLDHFITAIPGILHERGARRGDRSFLVVCRLQDLPDTAPQRLEQPELKVLWWWGVVGRLDTEVIISLARGDWNETSRATAAELVGWDLEGALALTEVWDGVSSHLSAAAASAVASAPLSRPLGSIEGAMSRVGRRPLPSHLDAWSAGHVNSWGGLLRLRLAESCSERDIARASWVAQTRAVYPLLGVERERIERRLRDLGDGQIEEAMSSYLSGQPDWDEANEWEFGPMLAAVKQSSYRMPRTEFEHLKLCRDIRNAIAHFRAAKPAHVDRLLS